MLLLTFFQFHLKEKVIAQQRFFHINSTIGLSDNNVTRVTTDKNNLLWIGTNNGLNVYDGYRVTNFNTDHYGELNNARISGLFCDINNNIWAGTAKGLFMLDSNRHVIKVPFFSDVNTEILDILEKGNNEIIIQTKTGFHVLVNRKLPKERASWRTMALTGYADLSAFLANHERDACPISNNRYLFSAFNSLIIADFKSGTSNLIMEIKDACTACSSGENSIIVGTYAGQLYKVDLAQKKITGDYIAEAKGLIQKPAGIRKIRMISPKTALVTTFFSGIFLLDITTGIFTQYMHSPVDETSISENRANEIFTDKAGNIFISTFNTGLNCFNPERYYASHTSVFTDDKNQNFDSYVNDITEDLEKNTWIATYDKIIYQNKRTGKTSFYPHYKNYGINNNSSEIKALCTDSSSKVWASIYAEGVAVVDPVTGRYNVVTQLGSAIQSSVFVSIYVHDLYADNHNKIWACGNTGVFTIDAKTYKVDSLPAACFRALINQRVYKIWGDDKDNLWFATPTEGIYCYVRGIGELKNYSVKQGLPSNDCHTIAGDKKGNIYIGTRAGLVQLNTEKIARTFTTADGLVQGDCSSLQSDDAGNIWIVMNNNTLVYYNPDNKQFRYFSDMPGPGGGFKYGSNYRSFSGDLYWGNNIGLSYFNPEKLLSSHTEPPLFIQKVVADDSSYFFTGSSSLSFQYYQNNISFFFAAIDLSGSKNIFYKYKLEGSDKNWTEGLDILQAKYNSLEPGHYTFKVLASKDGIKWTESRNQIRLYIKPPFWKTWWFKVLVVLLGTLLLYALFRWQKKRRKEKELLRLEYEKKIAAVEMNTLRAQMNPHFIFNSLNSIDTFILEKDDANASEYLQKFSNLVRLILDNSRNEWILLENELKALELYQELESLRFEHKFDYKIDVAADINTSSVWIPPLIIQPYVENAIRHGLINRKEIGGKVTTRVWKENNLLKIQVQDNGIGRHAAEALKSKINKLHQSSHGMKISAERLNIINDVYNVNASVTVSDLKNKENQPAGTMVLLTIQFKNHAVNNNR